jgi:tetratricopeptide (TPR) repeat protein
MILNTKFWTWLAAFQVVFGLAVFAITRDYYNQEADVVRAHPSTLGQPAPAWPNGITGTDIARLSSPSISLSVLSPSTVQDPAEILRQAEAAFADGQYDRAADLYEQLLVFNPNDAEIYNNLGLTLHYLGRSTEALRTLNDGIAIDVDHQRSWLTLGYVNSQLGNTEEARTALSTAAQIGSDESVRQSALKMLEELP